MVSGVCRLPKVVVIGVRRLFMAGCRKELIGERLPNWLTFRPEELSLIC